MNTNKVMKLGRRLQTLTLLLLVAIPFAVAFIVSTMGVKGLVSIPAGTEVHFEKLTLTGKAMVFSLGMLVPAVYTFAYIYLYKLCKLYAQGTVFASDNIQMIKKIGYAVMLIDLVKMVQIALTGPLLTLLGVTKGYLAIEVNIALFIVGAFILLVGYIMELGKELHTRDQLTI